MSDKKRPIQLCPIMSYRFKDCGITECLTGACIWFDTEAERCAMLPGKEGGYDPKDPCKGCPKLRGCSDYFKYTECLAWKNKPKD